MIIGCFDQQVLRATLHAIDTDCREIFEFLDMDLPYFSYSFKSSENQLTFIFDNFHIEFYIVPGDGKAVGVLFTNEGPIGFQSLDELKERIKQHDLLPIITFGNTIIPESVFELLDDLEFHDELLREFVDIEGLNRPHYITVNYCNSKSTHLDGNGTDCDFLRPAVASVVLSYDIDVGESQILPALRITFYNDSSFAYVEVNANPKFVEGLNERDDWPFVLIHVDELRQFVKTYYTKVYDTVFKV